LTVEKHMVNPFQRQAWEDWLSSTLVAEMPKLWDRGSQTSERNELLRRLSAAVEHDVRQSLDRPLVVAFDDYGSPAMMDRPLETMKLVLPSGALMVTCFQGPDGQVKTLFFKDRVLRAPAQERWRVLAQLLVERYAVRQAGRRVPPVRAHVVTTQEGRAETVIRFVTLDEWGFCGNNPPNHWDPSYQEDWPATRVAANAVGQRLQHPRGLVENDHAASQ
jgi:hypothetical protein